MAQHRNVCSGLFQPAGRTPVRVRFSRIPTSTETVRIRAVSLQDSIVASASVAALELDCACNRAVGI
jgi:hypothetical protein